MQKYGNIKYIQKRTKRDMKRITKYIATEDLFNKWWQQSRIYKLFLVDYAKENNQDSGAGQWRWR